MITIKKIGITNLDTDCIVNAANSGLWAGGGVCGAIFAAAGMRELQAACNAIGGCPEGSAVITPGFKLKAKYIVHAVGPRYQDGKHGEKEKLYSCYQEALKRAVEKGCHSIGFPLISAGIFGYPKKEAWEVAIKSVKDFEKAHPEYPMEITFAVIDDEILKLGSAVLRASDVLDAVR